MTDPDWIFRFSSVAAVAPAQAPAATAPAQAPAATAPAQAPAATAPAQARLSVRECGDKWTAAKKAGTLGGQQWSDFKKAQCGR